MSNPCRLPDVELTKVDEESILYDSNTGLIHMLNPTGAVIWELLDGNHSLEDIARRVQKEFEIDFETALRDTQEFVNILREKGLLVA